MTTSADAKARLPVGGSRRGTIEASAEASAEAPPVRPSQPAIDPTGEIPRPAGKAVGVPTPRDRASPITGRRTGADKREQIMTAALELFVERGFYGTAVPEIADRAGVGAGTIYRYFDSKEALVNEIYREQKLRFGGIATDDFPATAPIREQFRVLWTRMARFAIEHPSSFVFLELHHHARYLDAASRAVEQRMTELFARIVIDAQARQEFKPGDPHVLMGLVMGGFIGVIRRCVDGDRPLGDADWKLAEQCMWEAIRA